MHIQQRRWLGGGVTTSTTRLSTSESKSSLAKIRAWFRNVYATLLWLFLLLIAIWMAFDTSAKLTQTAESLSLTPSLQKILRK